MFLVITILLESESKGNVYSLVFLQETMSFSFCFIFNISEPNHPDT